MRATRAGAVPMSVVAVVALALAGCSAGPDSKPGTEGTAGSQVLTLSGWAGDDVMPVIIDAFEERNTGVTVEFTGLPWPDILTVINTEMVSGTASDVAVVFPGNGNPITAQTLARGSFLADLTDQSWPSGFTDANRKVMGVDGKILMGANNVTIIPATYNTQALESLGATAPTTWSEVLQLCATAKADGKVAYALGGLAGGTYDYLAYPLTATLVDGPNPDFAEQQATGQVSFSNSGWRTAFEKYLELLDAGCFSEDALGTSLEAAQEQVAKGEAVGIVTVSNQIGDVERAAPDGTTFETAAFPATDDPTATVLPVGLGAGYGVNANGNTDLGKKFLDFYMSDEAMQLAIDAGSIFPSVPVEGFEPTPTLSGVAEQVQSDRTAAFPDQTWPNATVTQVFQDELQKLLGGQTTVDDALKAMDAAYNS